MVSPNFELWVVAARRRSQAPFFDDDLWPPTALSVTERRVSTMSASVRETLA
jgi:hypothetical protein